jgi:hypothetical protein
MQKSREKFGQKCNVMAMRLAAVVAACAGSLATAQTFSVVDSFDDGNDAGWVRGTTGVVQQSQGRWEVSSSGYRVRSSTTIPVGQFGSVVSILNSSGEAQFQNGIWRVKVRVNNANAAATIGARAGGDDDDDDSAYAVNLNAVQNDANAVELVRGEGPNRAILGVIPRSTLDIDPNVDYQVEFGLVGSNLSVRVWRDGTQRPAEPQIATIDSTLAVGFFYLGSYRSDEIAGAAAADARFDDLAFAPQTPGGGGRWGAGGCG